VLGLYTASSRSSGKVHQFSIRNEDQVMGGPKHEQVLGLYTASSRSSGKVHQFNNRDEAMQAVEQGKVAFDDELEFPD
jgi:polygalacturonase